MAEEQQQQSQAQSILQSIMDKRAEWAAEQPSLGAELRAIGREALKDVRSTVMETFLGSPEIGMEPGTPLNPTPQMVTQDLGTMGNFQNMLEGYAARAAERSPEQDRGMER